MYLHQPHTFTVPSSSSKSLILTDAATHVAAAPPPAPQMPTPQLSITHTRPPRRRRPVDDVAPTVPSAMDLTYCTKSAGTLRRYVAESLIFFVTFSAA